MTNLTGTIHATRNRHVLVEHTDTRYAHVVPCEPDGTPHYNGRRSRILLDGKGGLRGYRPVDGEKRTEGRAEERAMSSDLDLTAAIEAAARHAWTWTRTEEHADGCTGRPEWDQASDGHREAWLATAAMYVTPAAKLIVADTRRQIADNIEAAARVTPWGTWVDLSDAAAIARGGDSGTGQT